MTNNIEYEIELINNIIKESVIHGGDDGGPYFCNTREIINSINNWLIFHNLTNFYTIEYQKPYKTFEGYYNIIPKIVKKENI